jgi:hypothetical protein
MEARKQVAPRRDGAQAWHEAYVRDLAMWTVSFGHGMAWHRIVKRTTHGLCLSLYVLHGLCLSLYTRGSSVDKIMFTAADVPEGKPTRAGRCRR